MSCDHDWASYREDAYSYKALDWYVCLHCDDMLDLDPVLRRGTMNETNDYWWARTEVLD